MVKQEKLETEAEATLGEHFALSLAGLKNPRDAVVVKMRLGFEFDKSHTLEEVGKKLNVTRERVRQIEAKTLKRLEKNGFMGRYFQR